MAETDPRKCPHCGGQMVIEYIGSYGDVYPVLKTGKAGKTRIWRFIYEKSGDTMTYCMNCRRMKEN